ncbi:MAG: hypothetical protein ABI275_10500 [Terrimesophilobacter sp.]
MSQKMVLYDGAITSAKQTHQVALVEMGASWHSNSYDGGTNRQEAPANSPPVR